jgi:cell division GTPase FtsZ
VVAEVAKELGILTVGVVTRPFDHEGKRLKVAQSGIEDLKKHVDSLIVIPNEKLMEVLGDDVTMREAFRAADDVLKGAVAGIAEVITCPGLINVDFADVRTVMGEMGLAMMGSAYASGIDRPCGRRAGRGQPAAGQHHPGRRTWRAGEHFHRTGLPEDERIPRNHGHHPSVRR